MFITISVGTVGVEGAACIFSRGAIWRRGCLLCQGSGVQYPDGALNKFTGSPYPSEQGESSN